MTCTKLAFIEKGSAVSLSNEDGEIMVIDFFMENDWMTVLDLSLKSNLDMIFLENSITHEISKSDVNLICEKIPLLHLKIQQIHQEYMRKYTTRICCLLKPKASDRLKFLMANKPEIFHRFPQYYIASYMGIKPQSLSRLKKAYKG